MSDMYQDLFEKILVLEAENARLKAEVERLTERNQFLEEIDSFLQSANLSAEEQRSIDLEAQVERLTKAGDALVYSLQWCDWGSHIQTMDGVNRWNAAKEGNQ